jgi:hypothetical protein
MSLYPWTGVLLASMGAAARGADRPDAVVASIQRSWIENAAVNGSATNLNWVHPIAGGSISILGASWKQVGAYHRLLADIGGETHPADARYSIGGELDVGPVEDGGNSYYHLQTSEHVSHEVTAGHSVAAEHRYISAGPLHGQLLSAAWRYAARSTLTFEIKQAVTVSGNLGSRATSARLDYLGAAQMFAGGAVGRTAPQLVDAPIPVRGGDFSQCYVGLALPIGRTTFTVVVDRYVTDSSRQWNTTLVASVPLPGRR